MYDTHDNGFLKYGSYGGLFILVIYNNPPLFIIYENGPSEINTRSDIAITSYF